MLKQLSRLSVEADGRYATDDELKFLDDYLATADRRISAYEEIRDNEEKILYRVEAEKRPMKEDWFHLNGRDITSICHRDMAMMLRGSADAMLLNDLDRLRDDLLIWYQTIVRAFGYTTYANLNFKLVQDAVKSVVSPEAAEAMMPALQLQHTILRS